MPVRGSSADPSSRHARPSQERFYGISDRAKDGCPVGKVMAGATIPGAVRNEGRILFGTYDSKVEVAPPRPRSPARRRTATSSRPRRTSTSARRSSARSSASGSAGSTTRWTRARPRRLASRKRVRDARPLAEIAAVKASCSGVSHRRLRDVARVGLHPGEAPHLRGRRRAHRGGQRRARRGREAAAAAPRRGRVAASTFRSHFQTRRPPQASSATRPTSRSSSRIWRTSRPRTRPTSATRPRRWRRPSPCPTAPGRRSTRTRGASRARASRTRSSA